MKRLNKLTFKKLNEVKHENESLIIKLYEFSVVIDSLKFENCVLIERDKTIKFPKNKLACLSNC